ncbi:MAG: DUF6477 family protein [Pseudomonadota bacterium]
MPKDCNFDELTTALIRPRLLIDTARWAAGRYRRVRDLPGAVAGLLSQPESQILPRLAEVEARCEFERTSKPECYRPGRHVQVLAALLAETAAART